MSEGIRIIQGPPGAGKGLMAIQWLWEQLRDSNRTVVTNFAVNEPALNAWIHSKHPEVTIDLKGRFRHLDREEVKRWWCIYGPGREIACPSLDEERKLGKMPRFEDTAGWPPVAWLIDEADMHMGAREWATLPRSAINLGKMHRHGGHAIAFMVQSTAQLDKQWGLLAGETFTLKNCSVQRSGMFRGPALFAWARFYRVPRQGELPSVTGHFSIKSLEGLADCYETHAGAGGIPGVPGAQEGTRKKGWSLWWLVPIAGLVAVLIGLAFWAMRYAMGYGARALAQDVAPSAATVTTNAASVPMGLAQAAASWAGLPPAGSPGVTSAVAVVVEPEPVRVVGWSHLGARPMVALSNGNRWFRLGDGRFTAYSQRWVEIDGQRIER